MSLSIKNLATRAIGNIKGGEMCDAGRALSSGKNLASNISATDLVRSSILSISTAGLQAAIGNMSDNLGRLDVLSDAISNQLDLVRSAYALATSSALDATIVNADRVVLNLAYQAAVTTRLDEIATAAKDVAGISLSAAAIVPVLGANGETATLAAITLTSAVLFAAPAAAGVSAGLPGDISTAAAGVTAQAVLKLAEGILVGHLAKIGQFRDLISQKSESVGNAMDNVEGALSEIQDVQPVTQAQVINDAEQRISMLGSLLAADAKTRQLMTDAARQMLAL